MNTNNQQPTTNNIKKGILLVNLGSPKSTKVEDVKEYLDEFLMDERVIDYPWFFRALLVKGIILNSRPKKSAAAYKTVWTDEGSPLIVITKQIQQKLQKLVDIPVEIGMRYAEPSIETGIRNLVEKGVEEIVLFPLYPQYAMSTTETVVEKAKEEVDEKIMEAAEHAILEVGIPTLPNQVLKVLGKLKYRTSFGQNILQHSIEVAHIAATLAAELGANVEVAKRAGLLHDIGKAFSHEQEGSHALNGGEFLRKFSKENETVINAVEAHHNEVEQLSVEAVLVQAADSISASRPGARRETLSNYLKRLEQLEEIANNYEGIESSYAIQAGREIRLIVNPERIDDDKSTLIAREVAKEIEDKMQYPGQIKVTVVRETRAVEYAK